MYRQYMNARMTSLSVEMQILDKLISRSGKIMIAAMERLLRPRLARLPATPGWAMGLCKQTGKIRKEFLALYDENLREFRNISPEQDRITKGNSWKVFILKGYFRKFSMNTAYCPFTSGICEKIPEITSVMFSVLEPGTHIIPHRGPYAGVLRCHIPLIVPKGDCGIRIGHQQFRWQIGVPLAFDDTIEHEAWNRTKQRRVVLFIDFLRPLPYPLALLNRFMVFVIGRSPFIGRMLRGSR